MKRALPHKPEYVHSEYLWNLIPTAKLARTVNRAAQVLASFEFDAIAFRGMSGALIAPILALQLNKSLLMVRKPADGSHSELWVEGDKAARAYVIVDDFVFSGNTVRTIRREIRKFAPNARCLGVLETLHLPAATRIHTHRLKPIPRKEFP